MDATDLHDLADRLFGAFVAHDYDAVEALLAPGATITQNGTTMSFAQARPVLDAITATIGPHRYEQVRRTVAERTLVEEHHVVATTPDGRDLDLPACVVVRVDGEGRIESLDEYVDASALG